MKTFITVDLWDDPIEDLTDKQIENRDIDIMFVTSKALELIKNGFRVQLKITNLPLKSKRNY